MDLVGDLVGTKPLSSLRRLDVIEYESVSIQKGIFVVYDIDFDRGIPALLVQLWKFTGGYDHGIYNLVVNDFGIHTSMMIKQPIIHETTINKILQYRNNRTDISEKEEFIMNIEPKVTKEMQEDEYSIPYLCQVIINEKLISLSIPSWTPVQRLPVDRIQVGSKLLVWEVNGSFCVMAVKKL